MKSIFIILGLFAICSGLPAQMGSPVTVIVGGIAAQEGEFPYQLSLLIGPRFSCGASLIEPNYVLTAAHCAVKASPREFSVGGGSIHLGQQVIRDVDEVHIHSGYNQATYAHDIAILKLRESFNISQLIQPIELVPSLEESTGDVIVSGWGATVEDGSISGTLRKVTVPIVDRRKCRAAYGDDLILDTMICAGYDEGGRDSCQGDSGGPMVTVEASTRKRLQAGIVSFGDGCGKPGFPGVYTDLSKYRSWIKSIINVV